MVNKESFGSLEIGIRGVSVDITDNIIQPDYRRKIGIRPVVFCMAKTPDGIVYADKENNVCFFHVGEKDPVHARPKYPSRPLYALSYKGQPVIGFADGTVMVYTINEKTCIGRVFCRLPSAVNVMCTDDEYLYCASRNTVYKMDGSACVAQLSLPARITHIRAQFGYLAIVYGDNVLTCLRTNDFAPIDIMPAESDTAVRNAFCIASDVVYCDDNGNVHCDEQIGDFQLQYSKEVRHNSNDRKMLCVNDKVVYCDKLSGDEFGLFVKRIGAKDRTELERINSSVYLSIVPYGKHILTASQQDQIGIWHSKKWSAVRTVDTDSILRTIDVIKGYIAFVSGSHIFWLKIENWDKV